MPGQATKRRITGILLAGGSSSRMGREKGTVMLGDRPLFDFPLKVLESLCDEILVSSCSEGLPGIPHRLVCDQYPGTGPMGGIQACLRQSSTDLNMVLSYDMPLVNRGLLDFLAGHFQGCDVVLPALSSDRPEPLCGIYRKGMADIFEKLILSKSYAVHSVLPVCASRILVITPDMPFYRDGLFININAREDLDLLLSLLEDEG